MVGEANEDTQIEVSEEMGFDANASSASIEHKAYARVGLLGNPSDVYYGRTISFSLGNFWASVRLQPSEDLVFLPHPTHDLVQFRSLDHLVNRLHKEGYYGGVRLLMSICKVFYNYCKENNIDLHDGNFTLSYDTNIPRQAGLSGSSAIVAAALSCLLDFYKVRHLVKVEVRPNLVLNAEKEHGIVAGLQIGLHRCMVALFIWYVTWNFDKCAHQMVIDATVTYPNFLSKDFSKEYMDDLGHGIYTPMDISLLPPLYLIYAENPSDSGKVHSTVQQRWLNGDEFIIKSMAEVANLASEGRTALLEKDYSKFASLMNHNFDLRRRMFGEDVLGALNVEMVEVARRVGAASKFTGSGGAVVAFCPDGPSQVKLLEDACQKAGFIIQPVEVKPSCLSDIDLKTVLSN
ncbi:Glucuronokinase 1 [Vitis vinifera]|uniref:Glucuronokinase 1 n=1 Tax=Vitis vinifera TaxID=29760 RepID=A0A438D1Q5_VITVI|nr:Glucuronokinase 1 [Vitis vinifera]